MLKQSWILMLKKLSILYGYTTSKFYVGPTLVQPFLPTGNGKAEGGVVHGASSKVLRSCQSVAAKANLFDLCYNLLEVAALV
jgi:hypothetical protein